VAGSNEPGGWFGIYDLGGDSGRLRMYKVRGRAVSYTTNSGVGRKFTK
jgi:hypothetical protein